MASKKTKKSAKPVKAGKLIFALGYAYLFVPFIIFLFGWLKLIYALPMAALLGYAFYKMVKSAPEVDIVKFIKENPVKFAIAIFVIFVWVLLAGIGGFTYQNPDHNGRNSIFSILIDKPWPVVDFNPSAYDFPVTLVYYFLCWLPAALFGKVFGWIAAKVFLILWMALGVSLVYIIIANKFTGKPALWVLTILVLFSGSDYLGSLLLKQNINLAFFPHIEWWTDWQFTSNTTQLFWVYNQCVPAWLGTMLIMEQKENRAIGLILSLLVLFAILPCFGLFVLAIYKICSNAKGKSVSDFFKDLITFENILCLFVVAIAYLFVTTNVQMQNGLHFNLFESTTQLKAWLTFITVEALIWYAIIFPKHKKNPLLYITLTTLFIFPLIQIGKEPDFGMRSTLPILIVLMTMLISALKEYGDKRKYLVISLTCIFMCFAAITPFTEIMRSWAGTISAYENGYSPEYNWEYIFEGYKHDNYTGKLDSFFFNVLAREPRGHIE